MLDIDITINESLYTQMKADFQKMQKIEELAMNAAYLEDIESYSALREEEEQMKERKRLLNGDPFQRRKFVRRHYEAEMVGERGH